LSFDLDAILRRLKPEKHRAQLRPRAASGVIAADQLASGPAVLVPDTAIYIEVASGRLSPAARALLADAIQFHCVVALSELMQGVAMHDPGRPDHAAVRRYYADLIRAVPASRLLVPDDDAWMRAGVMTGTLARTQGYQPHQRKELMADALIYLSAVKAGLAILTPNAGDFGLLQQLDGTGRVIVC
jgi:predicted nucleic acid-binding protein